MIVYLLKSATCLALLLAFYHLVLEREKMHTFNRFYLLGSVLFSFLAPLYIIYIDVAPLVLETVQNTTSFYATESITPEITIEKTINYTLLFIGIYCSISFVLLIRFGRNLFHIIQKITRNKKVTYQKAILVLVDDKILPHTFWNYIFINKKDYENQKIEQELFTHELTHVTQKHTLDVLLLEFLQAIFWINPFFILLKKAVQLNHEFLADETVINQHKNTLQYQHLLVNKAAWKNDYYLASNLNYSLTKKRLKMMTTQSSQTKIWLKKLAVIPLLVGFIFLFAERVEAQEIIEQKQNEKREYIDSQIQKYNSPSTNVSKENTTSDIRLKLKDVNNLKITYLDKDTIIKKSKASEKQMNEYKSIVTKRKKTDIFKVKEINKIKEIYTLMSDEQKKSVINVNDFIKTIPILIPKPDWVFTYKRLANRVERTSDNRKANLIYLKEIYNTKMSDQERAKVTAPDKILPPPPPPVKEKKENIENNLYVINNANDLFSNLTLKEKSELNKNKNYFLDGKAINVDELMLMKPQKIKSVSVVGKSVYIISKTSIDTKNITEKSKKQLPSSFIRKANEKEDFVFNSVELVKSEKESKLDDFEKKQFLLRKTIIQATTLKENKFNFKIDGKESKINDVYKYILDNPLCEISTKKDEKNILTLNLDNFKETKMSNNDLQNVYSNVFENIK
tara:strand:- start:40788 stop:42827 length:2040 start_codon:yes stop_codon:yes gene_type:complete